MKRLGTAKAQGSISVPGTLIVAVAAMGLAALIVVVKLII
jgi:hypothetical protein